MTRRDSCRDHVVHMIALLMANAVHVGDAVNPALLRESTASSHYFATARVAREVRTASVNPALSKRSS